MNHTQKSHFGLIFALWLAGLCAAAQFAKISLVFTELSAVYPDTGAASGFLVTLISFMGVVFGLFTGIIVARFGFRLPILSALVLGALLSLYQSTLPTFPLMLLSRFVEGLSHLLIVVAAPTLIARVSADRHRALAMTLWGTFFGVAFAIVAWFGLPLVKRYGLPSLFVAHGAVMLMVAAVLGLMLPKHDRAGGAPTMSVADVVMRHVETYRSPFTSAPALGWLFYTLSFVSLLTVLPSFIAEDSRVLAVTLMPLATIAASMTICVALLRIMSAVRVVSLGFALSALCILLFWFSDAAGWAAVTVFASLGLVQGATFSAVPELNSNPSHQALANGALAQMGNLGNLSGTLILLAVTRPWGLAGLAIFGLVCYVAGMFVHLFLEAQRK